MRIEYAVEFLNRKEFTSLKLFAQILRSKAISRNIYLVIYPWLTSIVVNFLNAFDKRVFVPLMLPLIVISYSPMISLLMIVVASVQPFERTNGEIYF